MQVRRRNGMSIPGGKRDAISIIQGFSWSPLPGIAGIYSPFSLMVSDHCIYRNPTCTQYPPASEHLARAFVAGCSPLARISCLNGQTMSQRRGST
jgi:hypothetical protein